MNITASIFDEQFAATAEPKLASRVDQLIRQHIADKNAQRLVKSGIRSTRLENTGRGMLQDIISDGDHQASAGEKLFGI